MIELFLGHRLNCEKVIRPRLRAKRPCKRPSSSPVFAVCYARGASSFAAYFAPGTASLAFLLGSSHASPVRTVPGFFMLVGPSVVMDSLPGPGKDVTFSLCIHC